MCGNANGRDWQVSGEIVSEWTGHGVVLEFLAIVARNVFHSNFATNASSRHRSALRLGFATSALANRQFPSGIIRTRCERTPMKTVAIELDDPVYENLVRFARRHRQSEDSVVGEAIQSYCQSGRETALNWLSLPPLDVGEFRECGPDDDLLGEMLDDSRH